MVAATITVGTFARDRGAAIERTVEVRISSASPLARPVTPLSVEAFAAVCHHGRGCQVVLSIAGDRQTAP